MDQTDFLCYQEEQLGHPGESLGNILDCTCEGQKKHTEKCLTLLKNGKNSTKNCCSVLLLFRAQGVVFQEFIALPWI